MRKLLLVASLLIIVILVAVMLTETMLAPYTSYQREYQKRLIEAAETAEQRKLAEDYVIGPTAIGVFGPAA